MSRRHGTILVGWIANSDYAVPVDKELPSAPPTITPSRNNFAAWELLVRRSGEEASASVW